MGRVRNWLIHRLQEGIMTPPVVSAVNPSLDVFDTIREGNIYDILDKIVDFDPELGGDLETIGCLAAKYYNGIALDTKDGIIIDPETMTQNRDGKNLLKEAQRFASADLGINIRKLYKSYAKQLWKHGDVVVHLVFNTDTGITALQPLPMRHMTALDDPKYKGSRSSLRYIQEIKHYYYQEGLSGEKTFAPEKIFHVSVDSFGDIVFDNNGRPTIGVWSKPPIFPLRTTMRWKINTVLNDIIWRHLSLPRRHHKLNLSQFTPDRYPNMSSMDAKIKAAQNDAKKAADAYRDSLEGSGKFYDAVQEFITDKETEITYVEPKATTYADPNMALAEMNKSIHHVTGMPAVADKSYAAAYWTISIGIARIESMAEDIKEAFEKLIRRHLRIKFPKSTDDILQRVFIQTKMILERDRAELATIISTLDSTDNFTEDELRKLWGYAKLTKDQRKQIKEKRELKGKDAGRDKDKPRTPAEIARDEAIALDKHGPGARPSPSQNE